MNQPELDPQKTAAFADKMLSYINHGSLALMISIGHRTGLFDTMADMPQATSQEVADQASLNERYVREWLGAMVMGEIVTYDPKSKKFALPPEHAACLTRPAAPNNMAAFAQYIPLLGSVEDQIVKCFELGGGVPYSSFPRFQEVMAEDSGQTVLPELLHSILPLDPSLIEKLHEGIEVLDVGCGRGYALNIMAPSFPKSQFTGYDFSEEAIEYAKEQSLNHGTTNINFEVRDVSNMGEQAHFDLVTAFDAIHDQIKPAQVLQNIHDALKPGGLFLMQDIKGSSELQNNLGHPMGPFLYTVSTMHCMTVSLAGGGMGLGTMWGKEKAEEMLQEAGFPEVEIRELPHDTQNYYYLTRKKA